MVLTEAVLIAGLMPWDDCLTTSYTEGVNPMLKSVCYWRCYAPIPFAELVWRTAERSRVLPICSSTRRPSISYELAS